MRHRRRRSNPKRRMRRNDSAPRSAKARKAKKSTFTRFIPMTAAEVAGAKVHKRRQPKKVKAARFIGPMQRVAKPQTMAQKHRAKRAMISALRKSRFAQRGRSSVSSAFKRRKSKRSLAKRLSSGKTTMLREMSRKASKKRGASVGMRAVAGAWRAAKRAQRSAKSPEELSYLRAAGLSSIPNRSVIGPMKDFSSLLPQIGVGAVVLIGGIVGGGMLGVKLGAMLPEAIAPFAPAIVTGGLTLGAYMLFRNSKALARFSLPVALAGSFATLLHLLGSIKIGGVSLASKVGLGPLGEYTSMGEFTRMGARPGHGDDNPNFVDGLDDEPDFDEDEDVQDDEAIGGIFDKPTF